MASIDTIKHTLKAMGFALVDGKSGVWSKTYSAYKYSISVVLSKTVSDCRIDYGRAIKDNAGRASTQNLSQSESLVVLDCVDCLLDQGYPPKSLILEKQYPLGHTGGYLDVLVLQAGKAYFMIECKTWGTEFEKERTELFNDGGQLLSYYHQDSSAKFIALYASRLSAGVIERKICAVDTAMLHGDSVNELFESWDRSFFEVGIFDSKPYQIQERRLTKSDLVDMKQEDGGRIFNAFAEILRRHVVSDKPNAFNKIFNLFICKVQDEEKQDDEVLDFQWQAGETAKTVLSRLNDLYKAGMSQYLRMDIADHTEAEIDRRLNSTVADSDRLALHTIFTELRLYKNNEFAFKEVFDEKTFNSNAEIVREVVRLLHGKKLRYASKQQFLGDFFELLLNTSVKQEAGQFFTPIPIARFLIDSLPLRSMIDAKIKANDANFLPYFLDYASGSGHFMTEGMDRIDRIVKTLDGSKMRTAAKGNLRKWCAEYAWASEFVYGIEKDYRLAKTAKVSCFLNGDGEANMILGDGLDNFALSQEYTGKLLNTELSEGERDNPQFDVVAANPPYSVGACKKTIRHGEKSFALWPRLTDASSEIECLFVERAKHVLKPGGVAGLLLPISILSNGGIHEATRDILLRYFHIRAIAIMGTGTFMATGTNTVILFMQRRENDDHTRIASLIDKFCNNWFDMAVMGQENAFALYAQSVWRVDLPTFSALLRGDSTAPPHSLLTSYRQAFNELTEIRTLREKNKQFKVLSEIEQAAQLESRFREWFRERERSKMLIFFLANGQTVVLARAPSDKNAEKEFLGYEFSNRKGSEGLKILSGTDQIETALYSETNDAHPNKINTLIRRNFCGDTPLVPKALADYVDVVPLSELITFDQVRFDLVIGTGIKKKAYSGRWPLVKIGDVADYMQRGKSPKYGNGPIQVIKSGQARGWGHLDFSTPHFLHPSFQVDPVRMLRDGDLLINSTGVGTAGRVTLFRLAGQFTVDSHITIVRVDATRASPNFVLTALGAIGFSTIEKMANGQSGQIELSLEIIKNILIPLPPPLLQKQITQRVDRYLKIETARITRIQEIGGSLFSNLLAIPTRRTLSDFCSLASDRVDPGISPGTDFNYIGLEHISEGTGECTWTVPCKGATIKSTKNVFRKGDVLYGKLRPYLNKVWIAEFDGVCSTELLVLKPIIPAVLLKYILLSPIFVEQAMSKIRGVSLPRIKPSDAMLISVPDISSKVSRLGKIANGIETEKQRQKMKLDRLRNAKKKYLEKWLY
jgi:type I restriction enzyme M protein